MGIGGGFEAAGEHAFQARRMERARVNRSEAVERAHESLNGIRVNAEHFRDVYDSAKLARDEAYVRRTQESIVDTHDDGGWSEVFEAVVLEQFNSGTWCHDSIAIATSRYDDLKNGADGVIELTRDGDGRHVALAVDMTFSEFLERKFQRIKDEIDSGELTHIEYFESIAERGSLDKIPRVVIGLGKKMAFELTHLWANGDENKVKTHPAQDMIFEEMRMQLEAYADYAQSHGARDIAERFRVRLQHLQQVRSGMKQRMTREQMQKDPAFSAMQRYMTRLFNV